MIRKNPVLKGKATNIVHCGDDKDEKYSKIKESKNRLFRRVFMFFVVSFGIIAYTCYDISKGKENDFAMVESQEKNNSPVRGVQAGLTSRDIKKDTIRKGHRSQGDNEINLDKEKSKNIVKPLPVIKARDGPSLEKLEERRIELDQQVRDIKATGIIMETDEKSLTVTKELQDVTRNVLKMKYGDYPNYRVKVDLEFQKSIPDFDKKSPHETLMIEMAPIEYIPVSVYNWLEIARTWESGAFHRNAGHVLQATTHAGAVKKSLAFQEYSDQYPHKKGTVGYCGRPSGPCWYISTQDNTRNHGPGSQQKNNPHEADANFGKIVSGLDDVVPRIHSTPQSSWLDKENQIFIKTMTILIPAGRDGEFIEWKPRS